MIEPKRQAQILIFKYEMIKDITGAFTPRKIAIECAKITCNEILKTCEINSEKKRYWNEVKSHLEV